MTRWTQLAKLVVLILAAVILALFLIGEFDASLSVG